MTTPMASFARAVDAEGPGAAWERIEQRWWSTRPVHRYSHWQKIESILPLLEGTSELLDVTRGASVDGILGVLAARTVPRVTIVSPSRCHLQALQRFAERNSIEPDRIEWVAGCLDDGTLPDRRFDTVTALHVLEHADNARSALSELHRRTARRCIVAVPTCANPTAWVRLGGGSDPYMFDPGSVAAAVRGLARTVARHRRGHIAVVEMVDEYGTESVHRWYFPRRMLQELEAADFEVQAMRPDTLAIPWSSRAMRVSTWLQSNAPAALTAGCGFGTHYLMRPVNPVRDATAGATA